MKRFSLLLFLSILGCKNPYVPPECDKKVTTDYIKRKITDTMVERGIAISSISISINSAMEIKQDPETNARTCKANVLITEYSFLKLSHKQETILSVIYRVEQTRSSFFHATIEKLELISVSQKVNQ